MEFFTQAVNVLKILVMAVGGGFGAVPSGTRKKTRTISINTNSNTSLK